MTLLFWGSFLDCRFACSSRAIPDVKFLSLSAVGTFLR